MYKAPGPKNRGPVVRPQLSEQSLPGVLSAWCAANGLKAFRASPDTVRRYRAHLKKLGYSTAMIQKHLSAISRPNEVAERPKPIREPPGGPRVTHPRPPRKVTVTPPDPSHQPAVQHAAASLADSEFNLDQDAAQRSLARNFRLASSSVADWGVSDARGNTSAVYQVTFQSGNQGFFKPRTGENVAGRATFKAGTLWRNEVGVHEIDKVLGFKLTVTTTAVLGKVGPDNTETWGSLAGFAGEALKSPADYDPVDRQKAAVLHYVTGNTDGHPGNVLMQPNGRPAIIDGGLTLAGAGEDKEHDPLRSCFFPEVVGKQLDSSVVNLVKSVDRDKLQSRLRQTGIDQGAIDGVFARLDEVRGGKITGAAFPGELRGGGPGEWDVVKKPVGE
jgi:hypothetical protein